MIDIPLLGLEISSDSPVPLFVQVYDALRERIVSTQLKPAERLPPSRRLAEELGVSRSTVITAYEQLIAEGFAYARSGSGVYVSEIGEIEQLKSSKIPSKIASLTSIHSNKLQPFHPGNPDSRLFPYRQWSKCIAQVARTQAKSLVISHDHFGDHELRREICRYLAEWRSLSAEPSQVLITAGASEALEHCIRSLIRQDDRVFLEDPCYPPLRSFVENLNLPVSELDMDNQGALPPAIDNNTSKLKLVILTPSSQFPLGGAMPQARRNAFIAWAKQTDGWIIEDDYDSEFRYSGRPIPSLAGLDANQKTIYIGSFSKIFSSGLHMGFVVIPEALIPLFIDNIKKFGSKASIMPQRPLALFMRHGEYYRHIRRVRRIYAERRQVFINLLQTHLGELITFEDHKAGMHIAVRLPSFLKDSEVSEKLAQHGITCHALSSYYASSSAQNGLLMGFCSFTESEMEQAMIKLKQVIDSEC
jgi:GntR family transcriptional regulator / MocR family aminotransferase